MFQLSAVKKRGVPHLSRVSKGGQSECQQREVWFYVADGRIVITSRELYYPRIRIIEW
jgi:hypothetical protein